MRQSGASHSNQLEAALATALVIFKFVSLTSLHKPDESSVSTVTTVTTVTQRRLFSA